MKPSTDVRPGKKVLKKESLFLGLIQQYFFQEENCEKQLLFCDAATNHCGLLGVRSLRYTLFCCSSEKKRRLLLFYTMKRTDWNEHEAYGVESLFLFMRKDTINQHISLSESYRL